MTNISALEVYAGELSEAAAQARAASKVQHDYINGDKLTDVVTESGLVPTLAKQVVLAQDKVSAALIDVASQMAGAMTYPSVEAGLVGTVDKGYFSVPSTENNEYLILFQNEAGEPVEKKRYPSTKAVDRLEQISPYLRNRPRGKNRGKDLLTMGVGGTQVLVAVQMNVPRTRGMGPGVVPMFGSTPLPSMIIKARPRGPVFKSDVVMLSGRSVVMQSNVAAANQSASTVYDAKLVQEQNQKPEPTLIAAVSEGQVSVYGPDGSKPLTSVGTWLSAVAGPFNVIHALGSITGAARPHSITQDGRIVRDNNAVLHKLVTGQSLALDSRGFVLNPDGEFLIQDGRRGDLFTPYTPAGYASNFLTLPGGPRPTSWVGASAFEPVREYASGLLGESPASSYMLSMRKWHERNTSAAPRLLYSVSAVGGTAYAGLKKGTQTYTDALAYVTAAKSICATNNWDYCVPSMSIVHGESQVSTTQAQYVAILAEWISDYRADIVAITGQLVPPVAFISQMLTGEAGTIPGIPLAQLQAHNENPSIVMIGPKYAYSYFDQYHMLAEGYIKMGELEARAERLTQVTGKWQPLKIVSAKVSGAVITLQLNNLPSGGAAISGPIGPLALDASLVTDPGSFGFQLSTGSIGTVKLGADGASIVITATAALAAGTVLSYALQSGLNSPHLGSGRRGCVRDTDLRDFSRFDEKPLFNWLCAFTLNLEIPA